MVGMSETVEDILGPNRALGEFLPKALPRDARPLGTGSFSAVFISPANARRVVKVTCDEGSYRYLTAGLGSRHAPRVYRAALLGQNKQNLPVFAVEMERLNPCQSFDKPLRNIKRVFRTAYSLLSDDGAYDCHHSFEGWGCRLRTVASDRRLPWSIADYFMRLASFFETCEEEAESPDELLAFDGLTRENAGVRDDGTLVFFDPVCGQAALKYVNNYGMELYDDNKDDDKLMY